MLTNTKEPKAKPAMTESVGPVYCYMCTHTVEGVVQRTRTAARTKPGQLCPRCGSSLDSGFPLSMQQAA
jgi:hypothetical protein